MYTLAIENHKGERLTLFPNQNYNVFSVTGLNPPNANVNTSVNASFDGSTFKSSRLNERNIVISLTVEGDIEANRIELYNYIKSKHECTVYYKNGKRDVSIKGYVESFECDLFEQKQKAQISIICPKPYFLDRSETHVNFASVIPLFEFPFSIPAEGVEFSQLKVNETKSVINSGDVSTGAIFEFTATGTTLHPTIYNVETSEKIKVLIEMHEGDTLTINTNSGQKSVAKMSQGESTNCINDLEYDSKWLQLESGDNIFLYTADEYPQNLSCRIIYSNKFEGV